MAENTDNDVFQEELETLQSIHQDSTALKLIDRTSLTYKFSSTEESKDFVVEFSLTPDYPNELPGISMEMLYNSHLTNEAKANILHAFTLEAESLLGAPMLYSLLEWGNENFSQLLEYIKVEAKMNFPSSHSNQTLANKQPKKEHLTKSQKKKIVNKTDAKGEFPRGWNWVDVIKHLSQTGSSTESTLSTASNTNTTITRSSTFV